MMRTPNLQTHHVNNYLSSRTSYFVACSCLNPYELVEPSYMITWDVKWGWRVGYLGINIVISLLPLSVSPLTLSLSRPSL